MRCRKKYRRMIVALAVYAICGLFGETNVVRADAAKSTPDVIIYEGTYPGWPWIDRTPDGTLLCAWREGTRHQYSSNGKKMLSVSRDNGATWSLAKVIQDTPNLDERDGGILAISNTEWVVSFFTTDDKAVSRLQTIRTTDAGQTWSEPVLVNKNVKHNTAARSTPVKLSNGELLLPYYGNPGRFILLAATSKDNGRSWTNHTLPDVEGLNGCEWTVVEMPDKTLAGIIRNGKRGNDGALWLTKSADWGRTWSKPQKTNLRDLLNKKAPAHIFLHNGKPWVLYNDKRHISISLATTDDPDLLKWNLDKQIRAYQYKADGTRIEDTGYPCAVHLGDGRLLIVDYYIDGDIRRVVGYYVTLPTPEPRSNSMPGRHDSPRGVGPARRILKRISKRRASESCGKE